jgi:hypothetical protein
MTALPPLEDMRERNPCTLALRRILGWYVLFGIVNVQFQAVV